LTKQTVDDATLKSHVVVEGAGKVGEIVTKMMSYNALVIYDATVVPDRAVPLKTAPMKTKMKSETDKLGKIMHELYNLEDCVKSEKPVKIDLDVDLYQMEKV